MIHRDHDYDGDKVQPQPEKPFKAPSAPADSNKKVTEFFAVRRSVRKTKKEVQEERMRNIEKAIRECREEGLAVSLTENLIESFQRIIEEIYRFACLTTKVAAL